MFRPSKKEQKRLSNVVWNFVIDKNYHICHNVKIGDDDDYAYAIDEYQKRAFKFKVTLIPFCNV